MQSDGSNFGEKSDVIAISRDCRPYHLTLVRIETKFIAKIPDEIIVTVNLRIFSTKILRLLELHMLEDNTNFLGDKKQERGP